MTETKWLEPMYSCQGGEYCALETSYPAGMLHEYEGKRWCQECWENMLPLQLSDQDNLYWGDLPPFAPEHEKRIADLEAEIGLCHRIIKGGATTMEEVAYVFDIPPDQGITEEVK